MSATDDVLPDETATALERLQWCSEQLGEVLRDGERQRRAVANELVALAVAMGMDEAEAGEVAKAAVELPLEAVVRLLAKAARTRSLERAGKRKAVMA